MVWVSRFVCLLPVGVGMFGMIGVLTTWVCHGD